MGRNQTQRFEASRRPLGLWVELPDLFQLVPHELESVRRLFTGGEKIDDPSAASELTRTGHRVFESKPQADEILLEYARLEALTSDELDARSSHELGANEPVTERPGGGNHDDGSLGSQSRENGRTRSGDLGMRSQSPKNVHRKRGKGLNLPLGMQRVEKSCEIGSRGLKILLVRDHDQGWRRRCCGDSKRSY